VPRVDSLFLGSAVAAAPEVRVVVGRAVPAAVEEAVVLAVVVLEVVPAVVDVAGLRSVDVVPAVLLLGLDVKVLVLRDVVEVVDFFSSSLALILGRLR
jgi:hypothetical protein